ncbi:hypothetical protein HLB23_20620 [Nocardia uniformis]|uniref:Uncharacterized protein n=1 Tax=Nocardia uniformis TaxID=53432 RepID=A0A849C0C9_9NOCA|nr:hypothetical protein [Nocardia uniformis]NNH72233.1 hypothetical protein [Nocardia uniformis]
MRTEAHAFDEFEAEDTFLHWTVIAVVVDSNMVGLLPAGLAVAADLDMAAEQVCNHLPAHSQAVGLCYLVATPSTLEQDPSSGHLITVPRLTWVNRVWQDRGGWVLGEWVPAPSGLRGFDPARCRSDDAGSRAPATQAASASCMEVV